jgi:hypothetical protein
MNVDQTNKWAARIRSSWQTSICGIIECGRLLAEAKASLPHGQFKAMVKKKLPFSCRTAEMLMKIAADQRLTNANHGSHLPLSWRTLYELTKLSDQQFEQGIADGTIHPEMRRKDIAHKSGSAAGNEWFTPRRWIERARKVLGTIDCDPASCARAQETVQANVWYDEGRDGLAHPWHGNIWLNPPYDRSLIKKFLAKLGSEFQSGRVRQAIVLTDNRTDTDWFHALAVISSAVAFTNGRVDFHNSSGPGSPKNGSVLFYIGDNLEAFTQAFADSCLILRSPTTASVISLPAYKKAA